MIACACVASALRSQSAAERLLHATAVDDVVHDDDECGQAVADAVLAQLHAITHIENVSHFSSAIFSSAIFPASAMTSPTFCCCFVLKKKKKTCGSFQFSQTRVWVFVFLSWLASKTSAILLTHFFSTEFSTDYGRYRAD